MGLAAQASSAGFVAFISACFIVSVFVGIGIALILAIIPTYLSTHNNFTPSGEKYCISNLYLNVTFNSSSPYGGFTATTSNDSYALSQACYRLLQGYKNDPLLSSCLISNCTFPTITAANIIVSSNVICTCVVYYSSRCPDKAPYSGLNNTVNSTTNSACRELRMENINAALGSSSFGVFTSVPSLTVSNNVIPVQSIRTEIFSSYSQAGAYYCGIINQTAIATVVNTQISG